MTIKNPDINKIDNGVYAYIIEHNKKFDYYLIKCDFQLVFHNSDYPPDITSKLFDNKTMIPWSNILEKVIDDFKDERYNFNQSAEHYNNR